MKTVIALLIITFAVLSPSFLHAQTGDLTVDADLTVGNNLTVTTDSALGNNLTVGNNLSVSGSSTLVGNSMFQGSILAGCAGWNNNGYVGIPAAPMTILGPVSDPFDPNNPPQDPPTATTVWSNSMWGGDFFGAIMTLTMDYNAAFQVQWYADGYSSNTLPIVLNPLGGGVGIGTSDPSGFMAYVAGDIYSEGNWTGSDLRWKKDAAPLTGSLEKVKRLQGMSYLWRADEFPKMNFSGSRQIGLIAQDTEQVIPEIVKTDKNGYKSISYEKLTAVLVEAVKELKAGNEALEADNKKLHSELEQLRAQVAGNR